MATISIRRHPQYPTTHSIVCVIVRGRVRAVTWAGVPSQEEARAAWREDRRAFQPYDEVTGTYL